MRKYWYIIIITVTDWYEIVDIIKEVQAIDENEAIELVKKEKGITQTQNYHNLYVFGPFLKSRKDK